MHTPTILFVITTILALTVTPAVAQDDDAAAAEAAGRAAANANNPLANMVAFNIQNYYFASLYGTDETANTA